MSTPCILAYGSRSQWTGVPCRMEGAPESTGPVLLDAVLRNGVDGSAKKLVLDAPLGWAWAGGPALGEVDEYLAGEGLSSSTPQEILDRHYALYLLDRERGCLDITVLGDEPPLQPIFAEAGGSLASLPPWYPQPNLAAKAEPHALSPEAKSRAQTFCDENRIRWPILRGALRAWCLESLGDLRGVSWLLAGGRDAEAYAGGRVADSVLHIAPDQGTARFTCSDGRLRSIDIHDVGRAGKILEALARSPPPRRRPRPRRHAVAAPRRRRDSSAALGRVRGGVREPARPRVLVTGHLDMDVLLSEHPIPKLHGGGGVSGRLARAVPRVRPLLITLPARRSAMPAHVARYPRPDAELGRGPSPAGAHDRAHLT